MGMFSNSKHSSITTSYIVIETAIFFSIHQKMAGPSSSAVIGCPLQQEQVHRGRVQALQNKNTVDAQ